MPRTVYITVRVSPAERAAIVARSASSGMAPSAFIREAALLRDTPPVRVADAGELRRIHVDLKRIGNNLNQAARALNAYGADETTLGMLRDALGPVSEAAASLAALLSKENDHEP